MSELPKLPISAIIATRNEARLLGRCLDSIRFCNELMVVDLQSTDDSVAVAEQRGARVIHSERIPAGAEQLLPELVPTAENDWILLLDPDSPLGEPLEDEVAQLFPTLGPSVGLVSVPVQFYFGTRPLKGTVWGGIRQRRLLMHRGRVALSDELGADIELNEGVVALSVPFTGENLSHHYWMRTYREWLEKHSRYARAEATDRRQHGEQFALMRTSRLVLNAFYFSFVTKRGYRDRLVGLMLSAFWAWYVGRTQWELRKIAV
jgi:glycosyltransferase involved in cell wall biosynthesis